MPVNHKAVGLSSTNGNGLGHRSKHKVQGNYFSSEMFQVVETQVFLLCRQNGEASFLHALFCGKVWQYYVRPLQAYSMGFHVLMLITEVYCLYSFTRCWCFYCSAATTLVKQCFYLGRKQVGWCWDKYTKICNMQSMLCHECFSMHVKWTPTVAFS